ncbi:MAG: Lsr2 family protein [Actinomycetota bacterium]|nr:Lsr2 family protein [Actinomycetota bacterium]
MREWARNHGFSISARGRIPAEVRRAYDEANA